MSPNLVSMDVTLPLDQRPLFLPSYTCILVPVTVNITQTVPGAMHGYSIPKAGVPRGKHGFILWNLIMRFIANTCLGG